MGSEMCIRDSAEDPELLDLAMPVRQVGKVSREVMRTTLLDLCRGRFLSLQELATLLSRNPEGLRDRFLTPLVNERKLLRRYPHSPNHDQQAYRTAEE